jgi:hypothetical protein
VFFFVFRRLKEDFGDLFVAFLLGFAREVCILVARLRFPGKRRQQVGLGLASF